MILSAIVGVMLYVANRSHEDDEPRTPNSELNSEAEHEPGSENPEG